MAYFARKSGLIEDSMPVDTTRVISPRRTQKKLTEEELRDIDRKRLLGAPSG